MNGPSAKVYTGTQNTKNDNKLKEGDQYSMENDFQTVKQRRNVRKVTMGVATNLNLRAVVSYSYLYLSNLDKDTAVDDIQKYLKKKGFDKLECEKIK